jgi:hypothetical protein
LAHGRQRGCDAGDGRLEAHVEHAVHFVEHQDLDAVEADQLALEEVLEAAGSGDDEARAAADGVELRTLSEPADHQGHGLRGVGADGEKGLLHLHGQLARGQNDEGLRSLAFGLLHHLDDRDEKAERLAGSGLRGGQHVAAFQSGRDASGLHRGGDFKFVGVKPRHQGGRKRKLSKLCCQNRVHSCWAPRAPVSWGLQSEPDEEARARILLARACLSICVRENRKSNLRLARHSRGEPARPGAAARYFIARRHIAGRLHAPTLSNDSWFAGAASFVGGDERTDYRRAWFNPWQRPQDGRPCGYAVGAWGKLCQANLLSKARCRSRPNH